MQKENERLGCPSIYLTFDDGPSPSGTEEVLEILAEFRAYATFFMIGEQIRPHLNLARRVVAAGHAVGNHSWNHRYGPLFSLRENSLREWVSRTEREIEDCLGIKSVGFRPPAGVITPPLRAYLRREGIPLVMWNTRYYDAIVPWTKFRIKKNPRPGNVILLHDAQRPYAQKIFFQTLHLYLQHLNDCGYYCAPLRSTRESP